MKKNRNSSDIAYERDNFILEFIDSESYCLDVPDANIKEYDIAISEIEELLDRAIIRNDKAEIADLRRWLQREKVARRRAKEMIENNNRKEKTAA